MCKKIKMLSLFSGIGSPEQALKNIGMNYELVGFSEIDKFAVKSYCAIHNISDEFNLGDITKINIDNLPTDIDLITHGSPCQDFSIAGNQKGGNKNTGTRSSLMWNTVDIVEHCRPKIVVWENVKNLLSKKHRHNFDSYLTIMNDLGYNNYYKILNAKDYGIPQNRERIFTVSIRKDIDNGNFKFPEPFELKLRLKDMLEDSVEEKYFLTDNLINCFMSDGTGKYPRRKRFLQNMNRKDNDIAVTITTKAGTRATDNYIYDIPPKIIKVDIPQTVNVRKYEVDCESLVKILRKSKEQCKLSNKDIAIKLNVPLTKVEHWFRTDDCFAIPDKNIWFKLKELLHIETDEFDKSITTFEEQEGVYEKSNRYYHTSGIAPTLTCNNGGEKIIVKNNLLEEYNIEHGNKEVENYKLRKLTPKECWRLMGFKDEQFEKAQEICSNTQLYKQAGNSIVVNVLEAIFRQVIKSFEK